MVKLTESLKLHKKWRGKIRIISNVRLKTKKDLAIAYSPGVAEPCLAILKDKNSAYDYTAKGNMVAVITNGTAVLGLGNIGAAASMPVMEGKCVLFKHFAGIDAIPICINTTDPAEFIDTVFRISESFGGINLEDISAPNCFMIEKALIEKCTIPIFHDDQHGTAIVVCAALINAIKVVDKALADIRVVFAGAGAAALACGDLLLAIGVKNISFCDSKGAIYQGRSNLNVVTEEYAKFSNLEMISGTLADLLVGSDVLIGLSIGGIVNQQMISRMNEKPIIFALANPIPEIMPDLAKQAGAWIVGTGRSDFPNQINNVLAFPGVFKGVLQARVNRISLSMKIAAANALASVVKVDQLSVDYIIPDVFDKSVVEVVSNAVYKQALKEQ